MTVPTRVLLTPSKHDVAVDGVPVGDGWAVEVEDPPDPRAAQTRLVEDPTASIRFWLMQRWCAVWIRVREIPGDAVISFRMCGASYAYDRSRDAS